MSWQTIFRAIPVPFDRRLIRSLTIYESGGTIIARS